jgi:hypothetical protein
MSCFKAASIGVGAAAELQVSVANDLRGRSESAEPNPHSKDNHDLIRRMALVYGVTLLESMVKDYTRFLMVVDHVRRKPLLTVSQANGAREPQWWHRDESLEKLKKSVWKNQVRKWSLAVRNGEDRRYRNKAKHAAATRAVGGAASDFDHWRVLMASIAVRNCIIHSDGLMNDIQYKKTPLCDVAEEPSWDTGLIFDLFSALDLFNNRLSEICLEGK